MFWLVVVQQLFFCLCRDRFRTMINVLGDALAAGIIGHLCRKDFPLSGTGKVKRFIKYNNNCPKRSSSSGSHDIPEWGLDGVRSCPLCVPTGFHVPLSTTEWHNSSLYGVLTICLKKIISQEKPQYMLFYLIQRPFFHLQVNEDLWSFEH